MDGRWVTVLVAFLLPAVLIGVTDVYFALNPIAILGLISVMVAGAMYLLTYSEAF
jgi:hypothetical protein